MLKSGESRTKNTIRNFTYTAGAYGLNIVLSFLVRTCFIKFLEIEYLGVNGLFSNILSILSFAELGAGGAFLSLLYKPLADNNKGQIESIMRSFQKTYFVIGCSIFLLGLIFVPFIDIFTPNNNIKDLQLIYLLFLLNTTISYFFADKKALISADQKEYLLVKYTQIAIIIQNLFQIIVLYLSKSFVLYLLVQIVCTAGLNIFIARKTNHMYPFLKAKRTALTSTLKQDLIKKIKGGFCLHAGCLVMMGTDSLVISYFLGMKVLGIYSNYLLIIGAITKLTNMILSSSKASISNLVVSETLEYKYIFFKRFNFLFYIIIGFFSTCLVTLINPFIQIWIGKKFLMENYVMFLAVVLYVIGWYGFKAPLIIYRDAMGLYYKDRYISLFEGFFNLLLSIILVSKIGLAGVFYGTIISSFCTFISSSYLVYNVILSRQFQEYWEMIAIYISKIVAVATIVFYLTGFLPADNWLLFLLKSLFCATLTLILYILFFFKTEEFRFFWGKREILLAKLVN